MATVINNPSDGASSAGWIVAAVVLVAIVLIALFVWPGFAGNMGGGPTGGAAEVNVTVPTPDMGGTGGGAQ